MNQNNITTNQFSNESSHDMYMSHWPGEPEIFAQYEDGKQCGGCSFFAPFNGDWGLCCHPESRHHLETVFEHFTCPVYAGEGWGPHSFNADPDFHCRCMGGPWSILGEDEE